MEEAKREWEQFRGSGLRRGELYMEGWGDEKKLRTVLSFYARLHRKGLNVRRYHLSLRHVFLRRSFSILVFDKEKAVSSFLKGVDRLREPARDKAVKRFTGRILPIPIEWYRAMRYLFWRPGGSTLKILDQSLAYLVNVFQLASNRRISNFVHVLPDAKVRKKKTVAVDPDDKHAIQSRDVFLWTHPHMRPNKEIMELDMRLVAVASSDKWQGKDSEVIGLTVMFWTAKNKAYHVRPFWLKKGRSPSEDLFISDILTAMGFLRLSSRGMFFCRASQTHEEGARLTRSCVVSVIKATAKYMNCPAKSFSTTSNRSAGTSAVGESGATPLEIVKYTGHHSVGVPKQHYMFEAPVKARGRQSKGGLLGITLDGDLGFSTWDMTLLINTMWLAERTQSGEGEPEDTGPE